MKTLLLDTVAWDLVVDIDGNIAVAAEPYALAQDAASAIRTFSGEVYYDTAQGLPYFQSILGVSPPPLALMKADMAAAALTVPDVASAQVFITSLSDRAIAAPGGAPGGQVQIASTSGETVALNF